MTRASTTDDELVVDTAAGRVRGVRAGDLLAWRGIPYAGSTAGDGRLRAPRPPEPWSGVRDAARHGPVPDQERSRSGLSGAGRRTPMGEDCLTVNVQRPAAPSPEPRPVLVWIHGGAFVAGSSAVPIYAGRGLTRAADAVYVTFNYRLGVLGWSDFTRYATPARPIDANLGLRDQIAALGWVRENIAAFGGDPDRVTLFGQSAGAISVTSLMVAPAARGLFARAVAQSSAPDTAYDRDRHAGWAADLAGILGARPDEAAAALLGAPAETLVAAGRTLDDWVNESTPGTRCVSPVVDGDVLPVHPIDALAAGAAHPVPLVIGTNDREGSLFARTARLLPTAPELIDRMFARTDPGARHRVLAAYPGYPGRAAAADVGGDFSFWRPTLVAADGHAATAPTWVYRYDHAPRPLRLAGIGATHGTELMAVFGGADAVAGRVLGALGGRAELRAVSRRVQEHWIRFARTGAVGPGWPRYTADERRTLVIDAEDRVELDPRRGRRLAWAGHRGYLPAT